MPSMKFEGIIGSYQNSHSNMSLTIKTENENVKDCNSVPPPLLWDNKERQGEPELEPAGVEEAAVGVAAPVTGSSGQPVSLLHM